MNSIPVGEDTAKLEALDKAIVNLATSAHKCAELLNAWDPQNQYKLWNDMYVKILRNKTVVMVPCEIVVTPVHEGKRVLSPILLP